MPAEIRDHDTRTISLWAKVTREPPDSPPHDFELHHVRHSHDLKRPEPWIIEHDETVNGVRYSFKVIVDVVPERKVFFPGEERGYLRFNVTASGSIEPPPDDVPLRRIRNASWLDEKTIDAGMWIRIGPLRTSERIFLDVYLQFAP